MFPTFCDGGGAQTCTGSAYKMIIFIVPRKPPSDVTTRQLPFLRLMCFFVSPRFFHLFLQHTLFSVLYSMERIDLLFTCSIFYLPHLYLTIYSPDIFPSPIFTSSFECFGHITAVLTIIFKMFKSAVIDRHWSYILSIYQMTCDLQQRISILGRKHVL